MFENQKSQGYNYLSVAKDAKQKRYAESFFYNSADLYIRNQNIVKVRKVEIECLTFPTCLFGCFFFKRRDSLGEGVDLFVFAAICFNERRNKLIVIDSGCKYML